jgi:hypothetical protein
VPTTYLQARDDMFALFRAAWIDPVTGAGAIVGAAIPDVEFPGDERQGVKPTDVYWARVTLLPNDTEQTGLSNGAFAPGNRRYTSYGLIAVQIFGPRQNSDVADKLALLAQCAQKAFRKETANGVTLLNASFRPMTPEPNWEAVIVQAEYEFDEIG